MVKAFLRREVAIFAVRAALVAISVLAVTTVDHRSARAQDRPTLSGTWSASAIGERWNIGDWGDACGPKPSPHGASGASVSITESGGELTFSGGGYSRTNTCFEQGFGVTSHSASPRFWRTRCGTGADDPRKATIVTTISATDSSINFDETGEYQFILKDQNCTASVRRNRTYTLVHRLGDDPPPVASATATASAVTAPTAAPTPVTAPAALPTSDKSANACSDVGDVARIEVRPSRKLLKPGETFQLKAALMDDAGCRVSQLPAWSVPPDAKLTVSTTGLVTVAADAGEGEILVSAAVNGRAAKVSIEVVSPDRYAALLAGGTATENDDAAVAVVTTGGVGSRAATASDSSKKRKTIFLGIVGGAVVLLGVAGIVLFRRQKPEVEEVEELIPAETKMTVVRKKRMVANPKRAGAAGAGPESLPNPMQATTPSPVAPTIACPTCGKVVSIGTAFCPQDGTRIPGPAASTLPAPAPPPSSTGPSKICPACGLRYAATATFCGKEGATLVLVN